MLTMLLHQSHGSLECGRFENGAEKLGEVELSLEISSSKSTAAESSKFWLCVEYSNLFVEGNQRYCHVLKLFKGEEF